MHPLFACFDLFGGDNLTYSIVSFWPSVCVFYHTAMHSIMYQNVSEVVRHHNLYQRQFKTQMYRIHFCKCGRWILLCRFLMMPITWSEPKWRWCGQLFLGLGVMLARWQSPAVHTAIHTLASSVRCCRVLYNPDLPLTSFSFPRKSWVLVRLFFNCPPSS